MISMVHVSKEYVEGIKALDDVSFMVEKGEITAVLGKNGAGKSTIFKILCGLIDEYEGESKIFGERSSIAFSNKISYMPETRGMDTRRYVLEHLIELVMYKGMTKKEAEAEVLKWLKEFSLEDRKYQRICSLSKGNQQKLQLITAIASKPEILILDEPFSGLDLITMDYFWTILLKLRDEGCTIIFSSHDLNDNLLNCDKFIFIDKGVLKKSGSLEKIQNEFPMILELKNSTAKMESLTKIAGKENVEHFNEEYYIRLQDEADARRIFGELEDKYSEKFYLRKMSIAEIFREIGAK